MEEVITLELLPDQLGLLIDAVQYYMQEKKYDVEEAEDLADLLEELEDAEREAEETDV